MSINIWTRKSIELANQGNYLDLLYRVYPVCLNLRRDLPGETADKIKEFYEQKDGRKLLELLLKQKVFPIKDSYVAYLKRDPGALERNPATFARLTGILYEMGLKEILNNASAPKEANRQMGPLFKEWLKSGALGCEIVSDPVAFQSALGNAILVASDKSMKEYAADQLGYKHGKGLDFVGRFNSTYVIGEAKFLTDYGGHQNAQFADAIATLTSRLASHSTEVVKIAILDGVLYIPDKSGLYRGLLKYSKRNPIMSALLLRDFLYTL